MLKEYTGKNNKRHCLSCAIRQKIFFRRLRSITCPDLRVKETFLCLTYFLVIIFEIEGKHEFVRKRQKDHKIVHIFLASFDNCECSSWKVEVYEN